jgi:ketosteroid isomerase-like protein
MDQLRQRNGGALDLFVVDIQITNEEVGVNGNLAFSRGNYVATFSPKDGAQPIPVDGKFMTILKKQPDGSWKIHRDMFNSNVAPDGQ